MAKEGTYKELSAGYDLVKTVNGITGTRQFIDSYPGATDSLPEMGDKLSETDEELSTVVVTQIRETYYGNDCTQKLYVVSYANTPGTSDDPDNPDNSDPDNLPISGGMSGESINIDGEKTGVKEKWFWKNGAECDQQLFKKIITGTFKVTRRLAALEIKTWSEAAGKINSANFKIGGNTFGEGLVMFEGVDHEEYRNSKGERRYKVGFTFTIKAQKQGSTYVGWNYNYDPKTGTFREVVFGSSTGTVHLFEATNLGSLLAGTEEP
jgi:hypothetical protein